jgi:hypothetical protein
MGRFLRGGISVYVPRRVEYCQNQRKIDITM